MIYDYYYIMNSVRSNNLRLKYQMFTLSICKDYKVVSNVHSYYLFYIPDVKLK